MTLRRNLQAIESRSVRGVSDIDLVLLELAPEGHPVDAQNLGRARAGLPFVC